MLWRKMACFRPHIEPHENSGSPCLHGHYLRTSLHSQLTACPGRRFSEAPGNASKDLGSRGRLALSPTPLSSPGFIFLPDFIEQCCLLLLGTGQGREFFGHGLGMNIGDPSGQFPLLLFIFRIMYDNVYCLTPPFLACMGKICRVNCSIFASHGEIY